MCFAPAIKKTLAAPLVVERTAERVVERIVEMVVEGRLMIGFPAQTLEVTAASSNK